MKYSLEDALSSQDKEGIAMFTGTRAWRPHFCFVDAVFLLLDAVELRLREILHIIFYVWLILLPADSGVLWLLNPWVFWRGLGASPLTHPPYLGNGGRLNSSSTRKTNTNIFWMTLRDFNFIRTVAAANVAYIVL